jgi:N-acetylmuramic acid 6-phosphate etherase
VALNLLSTRAGVLLGHVHDGLMVNLRADNRKLRQRARGIVAQIAGVGPDEAARALAAADGYTKVACLIAAGASRGIARALLDEHRDRLRDALNALRGT